MCSGDLRSSLQGHRVTDKRGWSGSSFHHVWTFITQTKGLVQMLFHSFTPRLEKRSLWYLCVNMTGNVNDLWLGYTRFSFRTIKMYDVAPKPGQSPDTLSCLHLWLNRRLFIILLKIYPIVAGYSQYTWEKCILFGFLLKKRDNFQLECHSWMSVFQKGT